MNEYFKSTEIVSATHADKRTVPRYTFIATVDIVEPVTDTRFWDGSPKSAAKVVIWIF